MASSLGCQGDNKCPYHQKQEDLFVCVNCNGEIFCAKCKTNHKPDAVKKIIESIPQARKKIQDFINHSGSTHLSDFKKSVSNLEHKINSNNSDCKDAIEKINKKIKVELDKVTKKMIEMCEARNKEIIKTHKEELKLQQKKLIDQIQDMKKTLKSGDNLQVYEKSREIPDDFTIPAIPNPQDMDRNPILELQNMHENLTKLHDVVSGLETDNTSKREEASPTNVGIYKFCCPEYVVQDFKNILGKVSLTDITQEDRDESNPTLCLMHITGRYRQLMEQVNGHGLPDRENVVYILCFEKINPVDVPELEVEKNVIGKRKLVIMGYHTGEGFHKSDANNNAEEKINHFLKNYT